MFLLHFPCQTQRKFVTLQGIKYNIRYVCHSRLCGAWHCSASLWWKSVGNVPRKTIDNSEYMLRKARTSSFELLRILCIYGIMSMHIFGSYLESATGLDRAYVCFVNSAFNMGVSLFVLISGYFGMRFSISKMVKLMSPVVFYAVASTLISFSIDHYFSVREIVNAVFAVFVNKYWFVTAYLVIFMLSGYINKLLQGLNRSEHEKLLFILMLFFVIAPTLLLENRLYNGGKGILNMFLMYIVGRYLSIYNVRLSTARSTLFAFLCIGTLFVVTFVLSLKFKTAGGAMISLCADNSLFIFFGSVFTFLAFRNLQFSSKAVNVLATCVFATYLFEKAVRALLAQAVTSQTIGINQTIYNIILPLIVLLIMYPVEKLRFVCFAPLERWLSARLSTLVARYYEWRSKEK